MELRSKTIYFRLVEKADAAFINSLRTDDTYNKYLSQVDDDIAKQEQWITNYKEKEKAGEEYYFIICRTADALPIGTVRIYDFVNGRESFCWGSWILNQDKTRYAALECALLIYDFAFIELGFKRCHMNIRKGNIKVTEFHKNFGVRIYGEDEEDYLGHYYPEDYLKIKENIKKVIESGTEKA